MKNEFKAGDLIFLINRTYQILLANPVSYYGSKSVEGIDIKTSNKYWGYGFAATPENRQALVTLYGEDAVPKIPLRGSELTKKLLEQQKYVICWVNDKSDERARDWPHEICAVCAVEDDGFTLGDGGFAEYAVPIDNNGNEIMEIEK